MSNAVVSLQREDSYTITKYSKTEVAVMVTEVNGDTATMILNRDEMLNLVHNLINRLVDNGDLVPVYEPGDRVERLKEDGTPFRMPIAEEDRYGTVGPFNVDLPEEVHVRWDSGADGYYSYKRLRKLV